MSKIRNIVFDDDPNSGKKLLKHLPIVWIGIRYKEEQHITNSKTHMTTLHNTHRHTLNQEKKKKQVVAQAMKVDRKKYLS